MSAASIVPSTPAPAPTTVCSSSRKSTTPRSVAVTSSTSRRSRSSNSPRYLVPATSPARSMATTRRPDGPGTVPAAMRAAMPSTIAVLPTPGSPTSTGLFLVRRPRISRTAATSRSRPTTGSSRPARASAVRSRPKRSSTGVRVSPRGRPGGGSSRPSRPSGAPRSPKPSTSLPIRSSRGLDHSPGRSGPRRASSLTAPSCAYAAVSRRAPPTGRPAACGRGRRTRRTPRWSARRCTGCTSS